MVVSSVYKIFNDINVYIINMSSKYLLLISLVTKIIIIHAGFFILVYQNIQMKVKNSEHFKLRYSKNPGGEKV